MANSDLAGLPSSNVEEDKPLGSTPEMAADEQAVRERLDKIERISVTTGTTVGAVVLVSIGFVLGHFWSHRKLAEKLHYSSP